MLAISEYARRLGGDVPGNGGLHDLALFELRVFSQNGEDGVIAEISRRAGAPGRFFVEIGAGDRIECNCAALAELAGWQGLFIEASDVETASLQRKYGPSARVSAFFVREDLPGEYLDPGEVARRGPNLWLKGAHHPPDDETRAYLDLEAPGA